MAQNTDNFLVMNDASYNFYELFKIQFTYNKFELWHKYTLFILDTFWRLLHNFNIRQLMFSFINYSLTQST